jgi:hypothetical protein
VDLRQPRLPMVLIADASVFLAGADLYLLITLASRYVQTPDDSGYASILLATAVAGVLAVPLAHRACTDTDQVQGSALNHVPSGTSA